MEPTIYKHVVLGTIPGRSVLLKPGTVEIEGYAPDGGGVARVFLWHGEAVELAQAILRHVDIQKRVDTPPENLTLDPICTGKPRKRRWFE